MKTFKDLQFEKHPAYIGFITQAKMNFKNNYGVSVITGNSSYTSISEPYEVAILYKDELTYNTYITNDVLGYQTEDMVTKVMKQVQELKE